MNSAAMVVKDEPAPGVVRVSIKARKICGLTSCNPMLMKSSTERTVTLRPCGLRYLISNSRYRGCAWGMAGAAIEGASIGSLSQVPWNYSAESLCKEKSKDLFPFGHQADCRGVARHAPTSHIRGIGIAHYTSSFLLRGYT